MRLEFVADARDAGHTVAQFLRGQGVSATLLKAVKLPPPGILVDGVRQNADFRLAAGQKVAFDLPPEKDTAVRPQPLGVRIVYENEHLAVLDKPAGMAVHPTLNYADGTLANAWMGLLAARGQEGVFRPVNRLDKDTSGLVLCAKNAYAAALLAERAEKVYLALALGEMPEGEGEVDAPIGRCADSIIRRQVCADGRPSLTRYRVLAAGEGCSLLRVTPVTGRTHQIRLHMAHIGHPLAGDWLYGEGPAAEMPRHALHCFAMLLPAMCGREETWVYAAPPADMRRIAAKMAEKRG